MTGTPIDQAIIGLLAGALLGGGYFALLRHSVRRFTDEARAGQMLVLAALRIVLAIGVFWGLVQLGSWALLAGLAGFLIARYLMQRWVEA